MTATEKGIAERIEALEEKCHQLEYMVERYMIKGPCEHANGLGDWTPEKPIEPNQYGKCELTPDGMVLKEEISKDEIDSLRKNCESEVQHFQKQNMKLKDELASLRQLNDEQAEKIQELIHLNKKLQTINAEQKEENNTEQAQIKHLNEEKDKIEKDALSLFNEKRAERAILEQTILDLKDMIVDLVFEIREKKYESDCDK